MNHRPTYPTPALDRRLDALLPGEYSAAELRAADIYADTLRRAMRYGRIVRIKRGVYRFGGPVSEKERERKRITSVLKAALERGYSPDDLKQWIEGAVEMNEPGLTAEKNGARL